MKSHLAQSIAINGQCCNKLNVSLHNKPLQLWHQYSGQYILSNEKVNGKSCFIKMDGGKALWYMSPPMDAWGFGELRNKGSAFVIMGSNWQIGPSCPHEVPNNQWMYLDGLMSNFEDWLFGGNDINVYHIGDNIVSSHNNVTISTNNAENTSNNVSISSNNAENTSNKLLKKNKIIKFLCFLVTLLIILLIITNANEDS